MPARLCPRDSSKAPLGEAGIGGSTVSTQHVLSAVQTEDGVNTGFSIANPTDDTATIELSLLDNNGEEQAPGDLSLGPLSQTARFFPEFFGLNRDSFSGTLLIFSDTDLAVASLKTKNQIQTSSLPSGAR